MERLARGLALSQLEHIIEGSGLSRVERGIRTVSRDQASAIADAFKMSLEELFTEQENGRFLILDADGAVAA